MPRRESLEHTRPHTDDGFCGKCRRKVAQGDRVTPAYIVDSVGPDPRNISRKGVNLFAEFELVHIDCKDPKLVRGGD